MSVWTESNDQPIAPAKSSIQDVIFKIDCQHLPVDHAHALSQALCIQVPWLHHINNTGIHPIHVAGSQNGWQRPEFEADGPLILSKRTRLRIRIPADRAQALINELANTSHTISGYQLQVISGRTADLQHCSTLFSRNMVYRDHQNADEEAFLQRVINECSQHGYTPSKLLCGKSHKLTVDGSIVDAKSLLIADVPQEHSLTLQEQGLGDFRLYGCGILIPHKDTGAVN